MVGVAAPLSGQGERARQPVEELDAEIRLEAAHVLRDSTLRDTELLGREAEVKVPRRGLERPEPVQRRQAARTLPDPVDFLQHRRR